MVTKKDDLITIELPQNGYLIMEQDLFVTQWDKGQKLAISGITDGTEVEFGNEVVKETLRRTIIDGVVAIPDIMLTYTETIFAYVEVITVDSQTTRYKIIITVEEKTKPSDYIYPDDEPTFREEMQALLDKKQDKLVAGKNITIDENNVISAPGGGAGGGGTTDYEDLENIPTVNGTEVKGNLTLEELGLYSRTEIDTKLGTKITLYTGTTAPISSPSAYPDFVEPSLYFDKNSKKLYTLFSAGGSAIVPHEHLNQHSLLNYSTKDEVAKKTNTYTGTGAPSNKYSDYPNAKVGDIYIDTNDYNKFYSVMLITESVNYIYWSACAREALLVGNYVSYSTLTNGYYNKPQVDQKINEIKVAQIVNELPEVGLEGVLYCVPKNEPNSNDLYDDYKYINGAWELIGTRQITIDLSNYPTFEEMETAIENSIGNINTVLATLVDVESEVE